MTSYHQAILQPGILSFNGLVTWLFYTQFHGHAAVVLLCNLQVKCLQHLAASCVECWVLTSVLAGIAVAVFRVNLWWGQPAHQPTKKQAKGGVLHKCSTFSLVRLDCSCIRNAWQVLEASYRAGHRWQVRLDGPDWWSTTVQWEKTATRYGIDFDKTEVTANISSYCTHIIIERIEISKYPH
jgi:hypothetical protein